MKRRLRAESPPRSAASHPPGTPPREVVSPRSSRSGGKIGSEDVYRQLLASGVTPLPEPPLAGASAARAKLARLLTYLGSPDRQILGARKSVDEGYSGEYTAASLERILASLSACRGRGGGGGDGDGAPLRLLDIGSGAGKAVYMGVLGGGFDSAAGIECNANREQCTWLAARFAVPRVSFFHGDAGAWLPPGATHIYTFNKTFPPADLRRIAARLNAYPSWRAMVSSLDARTWAAHGLEPADDVATIKGVKMCGSGNQYAMHLIERRRRRGGEGEEAVAEEERGAAAPPRVRRRRGDFD